MIQVITCNKIRISGTVTEVVTWLKELSINYRYIKDIIDAKMNVLKES
ncbi:MAG: hypothetical protein Q8920_13865 [Bacillota bacterium]|nr:hypothetical protein [Bacillota bacterium]